MKEKRSFWEKRAPAWIALVLTVPLSIFLGVNRTVAGYAKKAEKAFFERSETYGSVSEDLGKYVEQASRLAALGGRDGEELSRAVEQLREERKSPFSRGAGVELVYVTAAQLYHELALSEETRKSAMLCFAELDAVRMRLRNHRDYQKAARRYNRALEAFPASLLCPGGEPVMTFD